MKTERKKYITFDREVSDEAFAFIFDYCDAIEYLSEFRYGHFDDALYLSGTAFESWIPALKGTHEGESWGMEGTLYVFALTDAVKKTVKERGLYSLLVPSENHVLQNATLYRGEREVFSVCSHEGYDHYDKEFENRLAEVCCRAIEKTKAYQRAQEAYERTKKRKRRASEKRILGAVANYVAQDSGAIIYVCPPAKCTFQRFLSLGRLYFSPEIYQKLSAAKRFSELHPEGYPKTLEEIGNFQNVPRFEEGALYAEISRELFYYGYAEEKSEE